MSKSSESNERSRAGRAGDGRAIVVVRHASAGSRKQWAEDDAERPLDDRGRAQAEALVPVLAGYHLHRAYSAPVVRCLETIAPFARETGLPVHEEPLLAEEGADKDTEGAVEWLVGIAGLPESSLVCTQRGALTAVLPDVMRRLGHPAAEVPRLGKGRVLVLHLAGSGQLASVERLPRPF